MKVRMRSQVAVEEIMARKGKLANDELLSSMLEKKPDVMCIVETKLREEIHVNLKEKGYNSWRRDRKDKGGGGLLIIVRDNMCGGCAI
ncbi:hypothetical protein E2C01_092113 [Portunus trituberculatus]|uniref:Uncharacterized protein n=1 Tax=Portunus trituberculatus TaxID=210409 RepID=A0A5B7JWW7_PORTR|nr:hypothetical protein [Portunus trituberculatus]